MKYPESHPINDKKLIKLLYYNKKFSYEKIAKKLKISRQCVMARIKKWGWRARSNAESRTDEYTPFRYYYGQIKKSKNKNKSNHRPITLDYLKKLWEKQKGRCAYTNIKLKLFTLSKSRYVKPMKDDIRHASLDRIDSTKPYKRGNVQFVCWPINLAKNSISNRQMKRLIRLIRMNKA